MTQGTDGKVARDLQGSPESAAGALIQQRPGRKDCAVACFAMAEGVSYDEIAERLGRSLMSHAEAVGLYGENWKAAFRAIGWMEGYHYKHALGFQGPWTFQTKAWLFERRAILQVDSVNFPGEQHLIYWDGRELHDPSLLKTVTIEQVYEKGFNHAWLLSNWASAPAVVSDGVRVCEGDSAQSSEAKHGN